MSHAQHKFFGEDIVIRAPKTAVEVLEYLHVILPKSEYDAPAFVFDCEVWCNKYCVDFGFSLDSLFEKHEAEKISLELALLCTAIVKTATMSSKIFDGLGEFYSRLYSDPDDDRTRKETGPIFDGVPIASIEVASVTNTIREFGAQILQAPYWIFEALTLRYTHDLKRERSQLQKSEDVRETARINSEVFG